VTYPDYKGFDLSTCMGIDPTSGVVKASKGGAVATVPQNNSPTDKSILLNQATGLPATLAGPVLVVGTIGGNDVQSGLITVLSGTPAQVQTKVDAFAAGFGAAMTELTKPDRFGAGVQVTVLMTNIYDPSGGSGHFYYQPKMATCPGALGYWPDNKETKTALDPWNAAMANEAAKHPGVKLVELAAPFVAHAVSTPDPTNWFHLDCIHPNSLGQNAVRGVFWNGLVSLP
jgi:lysophospholipase L1-like esterase